MRTKNINLVERFVSKYLLLTDCNRRLEPRHCRTILSSCMKWKKLNKYFMKIVTKTIIFGGFKLDWGVKWFIQPIKESAWAVLYASFSNYFAFKSKWYLKILEFINEIVNNQFNDSFHQFGWEGAFNLYKLKRHSSI